MNLEKRVVNLPFHDVQLKLTYINHDSKLLHASLMLRESNTYSLVYYQQGGFYITCTLRHYVSYRGLQVQNIYGCEIRIVQSMR